MLHPALSGALTSAQTARDRQLAKKSSEVAGAEWVTGVRTGRKEKSRRMVDGIKSGWRGQKTKQSNGWEEK